MAVLNYIIWVLWAGSLGGAIFVIIKKIPAMMALPADSLEYKETFIEFLKRKINGIPAKLRKTEINLLANTSKRLQKFKIFFLRIYNIIHSWTEALNNRLHHRKKRAREIIEEAENNNSEEN